MLHLVGMKFFFFIFTQGSEASPASRQGWARLTLCQARVGPSQMSWPSTL